MQFPNTDAWIFAAKTYLAAMLALFIALDLNLDRPGWAVTTVFVTCQPFSGATQSKAVYRLLGTILGAAMSVAMIPALVQTPVLLCLALAAWVAACLYLSLQDRSPRSYIFMLAGYTLAFIGFPAVNAPLAIFDTAASRVQEIGLGVLCSAGVHSLIFPNSVMRAVWDRIDGWLRDSRLWSASALQLGASEKDGAPFSSPFAKKIAGYPVQLDLLSAHLAFDTSGLRDGLPLLRALLYRLELLLPILASIEDRLDMLRQQNVEVPASVEAFIVRMRTSLASDAQHLDIAALQKELAAIEYPDLALTDWNAILQTGLLERLRELLHTLRACELLRKRLAREERRPRARAPFRRLHLKRHVDQGLAILSASTAFLSILAGCAVWIETGWADGGSVPMLAAVACSFFATQDSPLPSMMKFLKFAGVAVVISLIYSTLLLPRAGSFEIAALMLAPVFIWLGLLIAAPATAFIGMVISTNLATLIGLNNIYDGDFIGTLNGGIATLFGIALTAVIMAVIRVRTPAWSAQRILKAGRDDLISILRSNEKSRSPRQSREAFVHRMLDRLHLVMPRLGDVAMRGGIGEAALLPELRLGANAMDLQRLRHVLPSAVDAGVVFLTERIADFLQAQRDKPELKPSEELRTHLDDLLATVARSTSDHRQSALLALAGMRVVLFRNHAPAITRLRSS